MVHGCIVCKKVLEAVGTDETSKGLKNERLLAAVLKAMDPNDGPVPEIFTTKNATETPITDGEAN
jgi:hypothetical protein